MKIRVGFGYDVHQLAEGRPLWLGGIKINHEKGLQGHSDADVLIHAICDALLGAANLRNIGFHFPDTSSQFENIDSKVLLKESIKMVRKKGFEISNIDALICAEEPKLNHYIEEMKRKMAEVLSISVEDISIKATTSEKMGFIGRKEGMAAYATVLIQKD